MRRVLPSLGIFLLLFTGLAAPVPAKKPKEKEEEKKPVEEKLPSIAEKIKGLEARSGFLELFPDPKSGSLLLALPAPGEGGEILQLLHQTTLAGGLGSNPVGLDRGVSSDTRLLRLRQVGNKVLVEQLNTAFRASSENPAELRAVAQSFATSVLWAAEIVAEGRSGETLIDLAPFLLRDYTGIAAVLAATEQGDFQIDLDRSAVDFAAAKVFPDNVELEAVLTFAGQKPGPLLPQVAPDPQSLTLVQHHSLVRLPPPGYETREYDPRLGAIATCHADFARGLDQTLTRCLATRHRLEKVDPAAERSPVKNPIVFYIDNGAPEPIRTALLEGANWWTQAFDEAGFIGGFRAEILPEDKDPLDVRWSVVQWVHRATRGWSYGGGVVDPRTGEIVKGHVRLGSQRIRQDRLLIEGLAGTGETGKGGPNDPIEISLARIRQLSAHEIGHSIGLGHNMAASSYGRASVMDYPAPQVTIDAAGKLDFSGAYAVGAGAWDRHAINHLYRQFPPGTDVPAELARIAARGLEQGMLFLGDDDARAAGTTSDARASLWDNGEDPVAELRHAMKVRAVGLQNFSEKNVLPGTPLAQLREVFAPLYLHHRYQLDAAVKLVGGMEHHYAQRGDGLFATRLVDGARQRQALAAVLELLEPAALDIPEAALQLMVPRESLLRPTEEVLTSNTLPAFDSLGAAATASGLVVDALLHPARLQRLEESHHRDPGLPGAAEVVGALIDKTFAEGSTTSRRLELQWVTRRVVVERLIQAISQAGLGAAVQAELAAGLENIRTRLLARETTQARFLASEILRFLERPHAPAPLLPPPKPPVAGAPIGAAGQDAALADCSQP